MDLEERIEAFTILGEILRTCLNGKDTKYSARLNELINSQHLTNEWFTPESVRMALTAIAGELTSENIGKWTGRYPSMNQEFRPLKVGVIMAGNVPLVGFHDFLSVLISGNSLLVKTSSKDPDLIRYISEILCQVKPRFSERISFTNDIITGFDVIIATGSDNSSRYFEYYFGKYPGIIRKNRNSIAIIDGNETGTQLEALGTDVFSYFGLGCRSVSKVYLPSGYEPLELTDHWAPYSGIISHRKYAANYDYSKAVYLVNREKFTDTGYLLLMENKALFSPVAVLNYEYYNSEDQLAEEIRSLNGRIQCIVGRDHIPFGASQHPHLWDYADGIDPIDFLLKKNIAGI
jgi:hypothetical protein